jgi:hypothetical protein
VHGVVPVTSPVIAGRHVIRNATTGDIGRSTVLPALARELISREGVLFLPLSEEFGQKVGGLSPSQKVAGRAGEPTLRLRSTSSYRSGVELDPGHTRTPTAGGAG